MWSKGQPAAASGQPAAASGVEWVRLMALAFLARACYEASAPRASGGVSERMPRSLPEGGYRGNLTGGGSGSTLTSEPLPGLPPRGEAFVPAQAGEWQRRAVRAYARSQERQWRNWTGAMFEPVLPGKD